jgi:murein DD-endopeptidase MepM/ murein hydrolase activator NlpD
MTPVEFLRCNSGRALGTVAAVGLAAVCAISVARAETTGTASLFAPVAAPAHPTPPPAHPAAPAAPVLAFTAPLPGFAVNSAFGLRQLSFEPAARLHAGVDIAAPEGEAIHATAPGQIVRTGLSESYGNFVEVAHAAGLTSFYAHMSRTQGLTPGTAVAEGQVLGFVGSTGHSTGPHLHFEIRKDGAPLDPEKFMGRQFATLADLPLTAPHARGAAHGVWRTFAVVRAGGRVSMVINKG